MTSRMKNQSKRKEKIMEDKIDISKIKLKSGNTEYIKQNLEYMKFIEENECKTMPAKGGKNGKE